LLVVAEVVRALVVLRLLLEDLVEAVRQELQLLLV
jgi:hypothetical protein